MPRLTHHLSLLLLAAAGLLAMAAARATGAATVWEYAPYRVDVWLAVDPAVGNRDTLLAELTGALPTQIDRIIGGVWDAQVRAAPPTLAAAAIASIDQLPTDVWPATASPTKSESPKDSAAPAKASPPFESDTVPLAEQPPAAAAPVDKQIVLVVSENAGGWQVAAREFDNASGLTGRVARQQIAQRSQLAEAAFRAMLDCFAPLARIDNVESKTVELSWRAGKLPLRDTALQFVRPGDLLLPVIREFDRAGQTRHVQPLDWTFIRLDAPDGSLARGTLLSGLRSPLGRRRRGKVEQFAIVVRPPGGATWLELHSRTQAERPLAGYEVYAHSPDSPTTRFLGRTDGRGRLSIEATTADPLLILIVKHGQEFLARLPIVPGLLSQQRAAVIDDDLRMAVEGFVIGMQEQLVDTIVRRKILLARLRGRIESGRASEAQPFLDELRQLQTPERFLNELASRERSTVAADPVSAAKIRKLFADTREAVVRYLDADEIDAAQRELAKALGAAAPAPAAPAPAAPAEPAPAVPAAPAPATPAAGAPPAQPPAAASS
jgi:hypothetical protein